MKRRRALLMIASAAAFPGLAGWRHASYETRWHGTALGAAAQVKLRHPDARAAERMLSHCLREVARLEAIFSLYQTDSELVQLNREGRLRHASLDMRNLLGTAQHIAALTDGAFDVTVQPLFRLFAKHFSRRHPAAPSAVLIEAAHRLVSYQYIDISNGGIGFLRDGMAVTLNGIAQGYISDRVADMLRNEGFDNVLLQLGETIALSPGDGGTAWRVSLANPVDDTRRIASFDLADGAVATSSGAATPFDASGTHHHIFDPRTGVSTGRYVAGTVIADRAALADALSTGLMSLPEQEIPSVLRRAKAKRAILLRKDGSLLNVVGI